MQTIYEQFLSGAEILQGKTLFERPGKADISYSRMRMLVESIAGALTQIGVQPGDRVAAQVPKSPEAIALYLATLQCGAVFLPLNTAYTGPEIDYFIGDADPRLFVCAPETLDQHQGRASDVLTVETLGAEGDGSLLERAARAPAREDHHPCGPRDRAAILYTSGTTGRSKGAVLTHGNLASNCEALIDCWRFTADDRLIHALPIFHTHGLFVAANMAICSGATMVFLTRFDADEVISLMARGTVLMGVPTFYTRLLKSDGLTHEATAAMRLFVSGSAPLLAEDHRAFSERTGHAILERYGMTETCMIASNPYDGDRRPGAVGMALPGVTVRVADAETGTPMPADEIGSIEVKGPNVFEGYWNMPEKTASEFRPDGFFITGDLGLIDAEGYLHIVGRSKDLVISGGYNVYPKEIEALIDELPGVLESAVIGVPHPDFGEGVVALVVPKPGAKLDETALLSALGGTLARYKQPKRVILIDELPRNVMGKVQKAELRKTYAGLFSSAETP
ncbi:malonyl-CoA/methylmalonyl-CoA synthetase [Paracoccus halophilus]|uniref:Malonyl-CoA synthase n=1 Tax=Paracoccus halophilus TaxID=376733 RepID=A0A099F0S7_9RHOB|nr:malonyl-CoA synthase [Paracoccus halophilus]KGJ03777.1 malonyl-CoA synthase [Paracoccus halophilus]SFA56791.1 malonyl-CoA/methylmalonyl-CoA synthetase [Paracoccus halophilus]